MTQYSYKRCDTHHSLLVVVEAVERYLNAIVILGASERRVRQTQRTQLIQRRRRARRERVVSTLGTEAARSAW